MNKIIDFSQEMTKRQKISIERNREGIKIYGWKGHVFIYLVNRRERQSIIKKIIEFINNKGKKRYSGIEIKEISEEECKEILFTNLKRISWNNDISKDKLEQVWLDVKKDILSSKYIHYSCNFPNTFVASKVFMIK